MVLILLLAPPLGIPGQQQNEHAPRLVYKDLSQPILPRSSTAKYLSTVYRQQLSPQHLSRVRLDQLQWLWHFGMRRTATCAAFTLARALPSLEQLCICARPPASLDAAHCLTYCHGSSRCAPLLRFACVSGHRRPQLTEVRIPYTQGAPLY